MPFGPVELGLIAFVLVLLFGVGKLAGLGGALGKSVRDFRREISTREEPSSTAASSQPAAANGRGGREDGER